MSNDFSPEFQDRMGQGRPKGSKNKTTQYYEMGFQAGYEYARNAFFSQLPSIEKEEEVKDPSKLSNLFDSFDSKIMDFLTPFGTVVTSFGGLWLAEEYLKIPVRRDGKLQWVDFPPILHTLIELLIRLNAWISDAGGIIEHGQKGWDALKEFSQRAYDEAEKRRAESE